MLEPYQAEWQMNSSRRPTVREMELLAVSHRAHRERASPGPVIHIGPWSLMNKMSYNLPSFHNPPPDMEAVRVQSPIQQRRLPRASE